MICFMSKAKPPATTVTSDPELLRLSEKIREARELAERQLEEAKALSMDPSKVLETHDRFMALSDGMLRAIAQGEKLRQRYQRRLEKLEAERDRRLASARADFRAADAPPRGVLH